MQFSHSGTMLASASKDTTALVWRVDSLGEPILMHTLAGHEKAVAFLTWSPDDSRILTCGADNEVPSLPGKSAVESDCSAEVQETLLSPDTTAVTQTMLKELLSRVVL